MAKKLDPKAKAKRQKTFAAVGGAILLALLAFQVPRTLKMLHQSDASAASSTTTTAATTATTPPGTTSPAAPVASGASTTSAGTGGLTDPDAVPPPQSGQLLAFGRFRTKDPFAQQLGASCADAAGCSASPDGSGSTSKSPAGSGGAAAAGTMTVTRSGRSTSSSRAPSKLKAAVISVNGLPETVGIRAGFPAADPVFTLVSLTAKAAKIGIAGGSLASGAPTVTLTKSKPLTLLNTANGTRYVLRLLSVS
jgi:hypothetical protein